MDRKRHNRRFENKDIRKIRKDYESAHSAEDEILKQFVIDVASNNFKNSKTMITMANKIKKEIIEGKPDATRWYS
jgi:hypothetical protein